MIIVGNDRFPNEDHLPGHVKKLKGPQGYQSPVSNRGLQMRGGIDEPTVNKFLNDEWNRLLDVLDEKLGVMELSAEMTKQLKALVKPPKGHDTPASRLNKACSAPAGIDDKVEVVGPNGYQAQTMKPGDAAIKFATGKFSCTDELAWVLYNAGAFKSGKSYTSFDDEKKLGTRPKFSHETDQQRKEYVKEADLGAKQVDLRHIISSTTLNKALANSEDSLADVNEFLERNQLEPQSGILAAKIEAFHLVHSHMGNLWPGGAADNQAAGTMHGKLNSDARKEAARTDAPPPKKGEKKGNPPIASDERVSDCRANRFLAELAKLDDAIAQDLKGHLKAGDASSIQWVNVGAKPAAELSDLIRKKIGAGEDGYTVEAMQADLQQWLRDNPALPGDSAAAKAVASLRQLCESELKSLRQSKELDPDERVDECDLTTYLENLRSRGDISEEEKAFLTNMQAGEGVVKTRQASQKAMVMASVDYLQARSVACDKVAADGTDAKGYTQKDFVGDLENLAANFDFDLANPIIASLRIQTMSKGYVEKLIGVEVSLLKAKAESGVALFKRENGQPSVMDQFVALDYKANIKVETETEMEMEETPERKSKKNKRGQDRESEAGLLPDENGIHMSSPGKVEPGVGSPPDPQEPKLKRQKTTEGQPNASFPGHVEMADAANRGAPSTNRAAAKSVGEQTGMKKFETKAFPGHSSFHVTSNPFNPKPGQGKGQSFGKKT